MAKVIRRISDGHILPYTKGLEAEAKKRKDAGLEVIDEPDPAPAPAPAMTAASAPSTKNAGPVLPTAPKA